MVSKEEISMVGFTIVAYAGDAKTDLLNALKLAREGKFEKAEKLIEEANNSLVDAHNAQTKLMSQEANGEDTLMTTMLLRDEVKYFIDLYKQNLALRAEIEQLKEEMN